jgi:putative DNA primase/helicase
VTKQSALVAIDAEVGRRVKLKYEWAGSLDLDAVDCADELVEGLIGRNALGVLYGDSNTGKTFVAIDLGCAIARGVPWMGRRVEKGMVVYLATESPASVRTRLRAYQKHHGCRVPDFVVVTTPVNLFRSSADTNAVIKLIRELESEHGVKCELIIGDTLARLAAGANENSGDDMTIVLENLDRIRAEVNASVLPIHHTGKDAAKGMRGWSGMRAAIDTELEVTVDSAGIGTLEATKQRDMGRKDVRIGYRLHVVPLGTGKWGHPLTSCVVEPIAAPAPIRKQAPLGRAQQAVVGVLKGHGSDMRVSEIAKALEGDFSKTSVYNASDRLKDLGLLEISGGIAHLIKQ